MKRLKRLFRRLFPTRAYRKDMNKVMGCDQDRAECPNLKPVPDSDNMLCSKCGFHA